MRIIAGQLRGRVLTAPEGSETRPTSDRARESLFNILNSCLMKQGMLWTEITFADVFSGTGAVGLEAYSRGAKEVFCFENNPKTLPYLKQNIGKIAAIHLLGDALRPPQHAPTSILFMDAPYGQGLWQQALPAFDVAGWIDDNTLIIIETDKKLHESLPGGYQLLQERSAGRNTFLFMKKEN